MPFAKAKKLPGVGSPFGKTTADAAAGGDGDVQGRVRRDRCRLRDAGSHALGGARHSDRSTRGAGRDRQVHERVPRADQFHRQRCGLRGGQQMGRGINRTTTSLNLYHLV